MTDDAGNGASADPGSPHLSVDELADLGADALGGPAESRTRAHLDSCTQCHATAAELAGVSTLLASALPAVMPTHVTTRIEAALRAASADSRVAPLGRDTSGPPAPAATAAAGAPDPAASSAGGAPERAATSLDAARQRRSSGTRLRRAGAAAMAVAAVLGGGFLFGRFVIDPAGSGSDDSATAGDAYAESDSGSTPAPPGFSDGRLPTSGEVAADSGTAYTAANLVPDVQQLIAREGTSVPSPSGVTSSIRPLPQAEVVAVDSCVDAVTKRARSTDAPLAVDIGSYEGLPAVVVVLPPVRGSSSAGDIWVVAAGCLGDAGDLDILTHQPLSSARDTGSG